MAGMAEEDKTVGALLAAGNGCAMPGIIDVVPEEGIYPPAPQTTEAETTTYLTSNPLSQSEQQSYTSAQEYTTTRPHAIHDYLPHNHYGSDIASRPIASSANPGCLVLREVDPEPLVVRLEVRRKKN